MQFLKKKTVKKKKILFQSKLWRNPYQTSSIHSIKFFSRKKRVGETTLELHKALILEMVEG